MNEEKRKRKDQSEIQTKKEVIQLRRDSPRKFTNQDGVYQVLRKKNKDRLEKKAKCTLRSREISDILLHV